MSFFDENKKEEKVPIDKLSKIYNYAEKLKATVGYYDGKNSSKAPSDSSEKLTKGS
ncbi:MAG: hypothetical protein IMF19_02305 [Proteobacteria bacterium]|nr:hypothetical protein [Pseudomonadota bacterium]